MSYSVNWSDDALAALADVWTIATNQQAVTDAADRIDQLLAIDPKANGQPRSEGLYAIDISPLHAQFEVSEKTRVVRVVSVALLL